MQALCSNDALQPLDKCLQPGNSAKRTKYRGRCSVCAITPQRSALTSYLFTVGQAHIVTEGGLKALIYLSQSTDPDCQRYASMTLSNVAANRQNRVPVVEAGGGTIELTLEIDRKWWRSEEDVYWKKSTSFPLYHRCCVS